METTATILHADLDAFYASVEQLLDPSLRGKPIAVGGGVVLAASYEAKAFGVRGGMSGRRARELCPQLHFVGGHFKEYQRLGDAAIKVLGDFTPLVERLSIDEAFADVAGCAASLWSAGRDCQRDTPTRAGGARTPDFGGRGAHQASRQDRLAGGQAGRAGRCRSQDRARFPSRSAGRADVGRWPRHQGAAGRHGCASPSDSWRTFSRRRLEGLLGRALGDKLAALAWNRDPREIKTQRRSHSAGAQSALGRKPAEERIFRPTLLHLADRIATRLRAKSRPGRTVTVRVRFADMRSVTRSVTLPAPISATRMLAEVAEDLVRGVIGGPPGREDHLVAGDFGFESGGASGSCSSSCRLDWRMSRAAPARRGHGAVGRRPRGRCDPRSLRMGGHRLRPGRVGHLAIRSRRVPSARGEGSVTVKSSY